MCEIQQGTSDERGGGPQQRKTARLATKKMEAVIEETSEPEPGTASDYFKIDYKAAARDALNRVQLELVTR